MSPSVFPDEAPRHLLYFIQRIPGKCVCVGSAALYRSTVAEDLPPSLLLCGHRNWNQSARSHAGDMS